MKKSPLLSSILTCLMPFVLISSTSAVASAAFALLVRAHLTSSRRLRSVSCTCDMPHAQNHDTDKQQTLCKLIGAPHVKAANKRSIHRIGSTPVGRQPWTMNFVNRSSTPDGRQPHAVYVSNSAERSRLKHRREVPTSHFSEASFTVRDGPAKNTKQRSCSFPTKRHTSAARQSNDNKHLTTQYQAS
jgi:hypothetical protein